MFSKCLLDKFIGELYIYTYILTHCLSYYQEFFLAKKLPKSRGQIR